MSAVVLRCPNCGTTKAAAGECEACHEAQVRFYCTNHTPGLWLEAGACPQCGARFGEPAGARAGAPRPAAPARGPAAAAPAPTPAAPVRPRAPARPAAAARPPASSAPPPAMPPAAPRRPAAPGEAWGRGAEPAAPPDEIDARSERMAAHDAARARMREVLEAATRAPGAPDESMPPGLGAPVGRGLGGCLMRLVLLVMFLFIALMLGLFSLGGSLFPCFRIFF